MSLVTGEHRGEVGGVGCHYHNAEKCITEFGETLTETHRAVAEVVTACGRVKGKEGEPNAFAGFILRQ